MNSMHSILMIIVIAFVTMFLRFLPFFIFDGKRETPSYVAYLGRVLPFAMMGMLVIYCLKGITFAAAPYGIPELAACAVVIGLHLWKRNTMLSIGGGTVFYMMLVQLVF